MRYTPPTIALPPRLLTAADRRERGDLLPPGEGALRPRIDAVAGEQRPLLVPEALNAAAHLRPDVRERGAGGNLHADRRRAGGFPIAGEQEHRHGHQASPVVRAAVAACRRLSWTRRRTSVTMASIPDFTSIRRVKAVEPGVCTIDLSSSTVRAAGPRAGAGIGTSSPRAVRSGTSPRLTQPIGRRAARQRPRNICTSPRSPCGSPTRAKPVEKLTTGP